MTGFTCSEKESYMSKGNLEARKAYYLKNREKYREYNRKWAIKNKVKRKEYHIKYHQENKEKRNAYTRKFNLKKRFGITPEEYEKLLVGQKSVCLICSKIGTSKSKKGGKLYKLAVDHNHNTGKIRGLLCSKCNIGLGNFNDDVSLLEKAKQYILENRKQIVGFTCGQYDICHAGHYIAFEEIKKQCSYLVVGLQTDASIDRPEKLKPIQSLEERRMQLSSCRWIDKVVIYERESDLITLLKELKPDIRFLGEDHKGKPFTGDDLPIKVIFNSRKHNYSSASLRQRIKDSL